MTKIIDREKFLKRGVRVLRAAPYLRGVVKEWLEAQNQRNEHCPLGVYLRDFKVTADMRRNFAYTKGQVKAYTTHPKADPDNWDKEFRCHCVSVCFRLFPFRESFEDGDYSCPCVRYGNEEVIHLIHMLLYEAKMLGL
jgi:hypothetical protein